MISKTFFADIAEKSPMLIFNNQFYQIAKDESGDDFIRIGHEKFALVPGDSLVDLEKFLRMLLS